MQVLIPLAVLSLVFAFSASRSPEAPTGFDNKSNGVADDATHEADQKRFKDVELVSDGLGPLYNAQSCREMEGGHSRSTQNGSEWGENDQPMDEVTGAPWR
jgi:hypothetical protein